MTKETENGIYKVKPGDSLYKIARQHGTTVAKLVALNKDAYPSLITNPGGIQPNWEFKLTSSASAAAPSAKPSAKPSFETTAQNAPNSAIKTYGTLAVQKALLYNDYELPKYGADNHWGNEGITAAKQWQEDNQFEPTGIITDEQFVIMQIQAQWKRETLMDGIQKAVTHMIPDPVRCAAVLQAISHLGAEEYGNNGGKAVDQYATSEPWHVGKRSQWCGLFYSWDMDQLEKFAGVAPNDFHIGEQNSQQMKVKIQKQAPSALKTWDKYLPQPADTIIHTKDSKSGHVSMVLFANPATNTVLAIDGNVQDKVSLVTWQINPDNPKQIRSLSYNEDQSVGGYRRADFVDISKLPNYDKMSTAFNARGADFRPTPSADPNFKGPDPRILRELLKALEALEAQVPQAEQKLSSVAPQTPKVGV